MCNNQSLFLPFIMDLDPSHVCVTVNIYRPKRSFGQGNIFTPVCHSFCSQGGYPSMPCRSVPMGSCPGGSPIFQGSLKFFWGSPIFLGGGGFPICQGVSNFSGGGLRGDPPQFFWGDFFFDFWFLWGYHPPPPWDQTLEYGQRSAGTHPTGMHSCCPYGSSCFSTHHVHVYV